MADDVQHAGTELAGVAGAATALIERERDLLKMREDVSRGVDVQASAITAATLALVAVAASNDAFRRGDTGWVLVSGILLFASALAGGIARLPAPPPLKAVLISRERQRVLDLYDRGQDATLRQLGRKLGERIRTSEQQLRGITPSTSPDSLAEALLAHWRARNDLARYRMHSKSAWFTLSLVLLYVAVLVVAVSAL